jgi:hypothetical protein
MSTMDLLEIALVGNGVNDVTQRVTSTLGTWATQGLVTGDALCCVTMASSGAGLLVSDVDPSAIHFSWTMSYGGFHLANLGTFGGFTATHDYGDLRRLFARTSETFLVRGPSILGSRRIYVLSHGATSCKVALSLL